MASSSHHRLRALPPPPWLSHSQDYTVVTKEVFRELKNRGVPLEDDCGVITARELHHKGMVLWLPPNQELRFTSLAGQVAKVKRGAKARDEGQCIVALERIADHAHFGYYDGSWYDRWISLGGRPMDLVDLMMQPF
ncbi:hypothetical protein FBEOM_3049 [Fusarium beomiforme]|uniref:Uncharacterized protein n=1 Tax=Fusarium beomiforme TaxID=44412 RepID=A0A9P5E1S3_9HYPO|nr:hypothetical protein FBEOM_3049 [Fusarium beomiforme]